MHGQGCRDLFEWPIAVSLAKKVEPKSGQALFVKEARQGLVGRTVLSGEKSMAQHSKTRRWSVGRAQNCGDAVTMAIVKCQGFFHKKSSTLDVFRVSSPELRTSDRAFLAYFARLTRQDLWRWWILSASCLEGKRLFLTAKPPKTRRV